MSHKPIRSQPHIDGAARLAARFPHAAEHAFVVHGEAAVSGDFAQRSMISWTGTCRTRPIWGRGSTCGGDDRFDKGGFIKHLARGMARQLRQFLLEFWIRPSAPADVNAQ